MQNLSEFLVLNAFRYPDKAAIIYRGEKITYAELNLRVNRLAHHLLAMEVDKGDRVGFMLLNSNQFIEILFACFKIGAIAVPLNFRMISREIKWAVDNTCCKVFVYGEAQSEVVDPIKGEFETVEQIIYSGKTVPEGEHHFEKLKAEGNSTEPSIEVIESDVADIIFTGGTTGVLKAPFHTHQAGIFATLAHMVSAKIDASDVLLSQVPFFHISGLTHVRMMLGVGGTLVLVDRFDEQEILGLIQAERITRLCLLPPQSYIRLMDSPGFENYDITSVSKMSTAVAAFPKQLMQRLLDGFPNVLISFGYGMTETSALATVEMFARTAIEQELPITRSVGREHPLTAIRLVDLEGNDVREGEAGEALVKSPGNMAGYWNQPELSVQTIVDGWVHTGDLLKKDSEGYFYFTGRKKDMIKTGGENVFAEEVEKVILAHPAVEVCAVIGLPDSKFAEAVTAIVKLRKDQTLTEFELIEHCKSQLSSYKKPRKVIFVDKFPITDAGKIQKFKLREMFCE